MPGNVQIDRSSLFPPQKELLDLGFIGSNDNWILVSATGSGKTRIAEWAIQDAIGRGFKAAYLAPLRAIVEEKHSEWEREFSAINLGLFTGETTRQRRHAKPKAEQLLLLTPEKLASYLQNWKKHLGWISQLDLVVIDEFHLIGDRYRGACIESLIGRLQRVNPFCRFVALTATLTNTVEIATWLKAKVYESDWRPIPLVRRVETFKKAGDKFEMLVAEIDRTVGDSGRVLVFVNSRKRSEALAAKLIDLGYRANFNHAGLKAKTRAERREHMHDGTTEVLITTSALEMGVNFPARKVVVYDSYGFDGESFKPLSIQRFLQCAGRAGRPGLDESGEAVIFVPVWRKNSVDYVNGKSDEIRSGLFSSDTILREVLVEISSRLSISEEHLTVNFAARSWWSIQGGKTDLCDYVDRLVDGGLVKRDSDEHYLSATALGRVASQMSVCPATVLLFSAAYRRYSDLTKFDMLLLACLTTEATPKLGFNFEEIDLMAALLSSSPSHFLDQTIAGFNSDFSAIKPRQLLSAVKCAVILYRRSNGESLELIAEDFDCYPTDLSILVSNACWVLDAAKRVFNILHDADQREAATDSDEDTKKEPCRDTELLSVLSLLLQSGIPEASLGLTRIAKVGPARARKLIEAGVSTLAEFRAAEINQLSRILNLKERIVLEMKEHANDEIEQPSYLSRETPVVGTTSADEWNSDIDPYRLRRALELNVDFQSAEIVRVSGGAEPHTVRIEWRPIDFREYLCDCGDFDSGTRHCKHVIRARLEVQDADEILRLLRLLQTSKNRPLRFSLGELWMKVGEVFDRFNDREVDYSGKNFLQQARTRERWAGR